MEFKNGDLVEIELPLSTTWVKGTYIGKLPSCDFHVVQMGTGGGEVVSKYITHIRKPKQKKEGWVNIYPGGNHGTVFETKELAIANQSAMAVDVIRIKWEE